MLLFIIGFILICIGIVGFLWCAFNIDNVGEDDNEL